MLLFELWNVEYMLIYHKWVIFNILLKLSTSFSWWDSENYPQCVLFNKVKTATEGGGSSLYILLGRLHQLTILDDEPLVHVGIIDWDLFPRNTSTGAAATETVQMEEEDGQDETREERDERDKDKDKVFELKDIDVV